MTQNEMKIYDWLKDNNMTITEFSKKIGCHRQLARLLQNGKPISLKFALAIRILTDGKVNPRVKNVGRPKSYKQTHNKEIL